ncbi:hypothetical protein C8N43_1991 [Litoreibacter ponti]|uniref:DUF2178 domain-containing protein n=1 Tax=Litoreibacter ponti TaxID=1510457 RepID=A0A2T6BMR4_9RHOB|nr:hypothetical protein [Litoreibacter ponti]PTX57324.1 hypothetical protein C8N43_1991 [Litoreibacter ponti]
MSDNPISRIRFWGNAALVAVVLAAMAALALQGREIWGGWEYVIGAVALGYVALSLASYVIFPDQAKAAWDEQVQDTHRASLAFGYWAALGVFLILLGLVVTGRVSSAQAFYLMAPVLGAAPALWFTIAALRGRAG